MTFRRVEAEEGALLNEIKAEDKTKADEELLAGSRLTVVLELSVWDARKRVKK